MVIVNFVLCILIVFFSFKLDTQDGTNNQICLFAIGHLSSFLFSVFDNLFLLDQALANRGPQASCLCL